MATEEGRGAGANGGCYAGISFGFFALLGLGVVGLELNAIGAPFAAIVIAMSASCVEAVIAFAAAYRFYRRKGLVIGSIMLLLFLSEIIFKIAHSQLRVGWAIAYALMTLGMVNGVRAAWARRRATGASDNQLEEIFE
jgi:hypothetical protein